jgi:N-acetylglucosamine kinase-like BadF-type ATPase
MRLNIGISGGHQTSTAVAVRDGAIVACATGEGLNLHTIQHLKVAGRLGALLDLLGDSVGLKTAALREQTDQLVFAVPGAETTTGQQLAETCLLLNDWRDRSRFYVADDTWAGLIGGLLRGRGICAIAGTGAAVYVGLGEFSYDHKHHKIDGWGHVLGDYGSGFQLALKMFRSFGRVFDCGQEPSLFRELLKVEPRIKGPENVQHWFDQLYIVHPEDWRVRFARLAAVATHAADRREEPDEAARALVGESAAAMAQSISLAIKRFQPESRELPIVYQGGMFAHSLFYRQTVTRSIRREFGSNVDIKMAAYRPVVGAALMACADDHMLPSENVQQSIAGSIAALPPADHEVLAYPIAAADLGDV